MSKGASLTARGGPVTRLRRDPLVRLLPHLRPVAGRLLLGSLAGAGALGCGVGLLATSAWLISRAAQHPPVLFLMVAIVAVRAFGLFRGVLRYVDRLVSHDAALRALGELRALVLERLEPLAPAGLEQFRRGDLLARFTAHVDALQEQLLRGVGPALSASIVGLGSVALVGVLLPAAGVVLLMLLLLAGVAAPLAGARLGRAGGERVAALRRQVDADAVDLLEGAAELRAFGGEVQRLDGLSAVEEQLQHAATRFRTSPAVADIVPLFASAAAVLASLVLGIPAVRDGSLGPTCLAVVVLTPLAAFEAIAGLPAAWQALGRSRALAAEIVEVLDAPSPVREPAEGSQAELPAGPLGVRVSHAVLRYGDGPDVLRDVSLHVPAGSRVAVIGPSGSGKSSLLAALLRFRDLSSGSVLLESAGGTAADIATLPSQQVRQSVSGVTADAHVFAATVRQNLLLGKPSATDDEIDAVARKVRLLEWIRSLPQGWETPLGTGGATVSGGQRSRLALARALLADPQVLVLDEPTAHLDPATEDEVMADLLAATRGRTVLLVTHRPTGLSKLDAVVELEAGRVRAPDGDTPNDDAPTVAGAVAVLAAAG
ncbi:MAG TPA: thiol reductant ABC exporter subunit CydC [Frankiaceae bacterium]|nr:thiol reductant ABC exporter subunit CydC [Frankiaceae bacterium]